MNTIEDINRQIEALEKAKDIHNEKYSNNIQMLDEKMQRVEKRLENTKSELKRDLLMRHIDWYETEIEKMDEAINIIVEKIDNEIERLESIKKTIEEQQRKEKESFEYNIQKIRECARDRNVYRIVDALESVANALEIIRAEKAQT
jgi:predicted  nucleic acid-binding Zn-ribbon protein